MMKRKTPTTFEKASAWRIWVLKAADDVYQAGLSGLEEVDVEAHRSRLQEMSEVELVEVYTWIGARVSSEQSYKRAKGEKLATRTGNSSIDDVEEEHEVIEVSEDEDIRPVQKKQRRTATCKFSIKRLL